MTVRIPVPLDGIDTDGDSVQLIGVDKAPAMGTAVVKDGYLEFTAAGNGAGTDTFSYRVRDRIGAENTGTVIVGIAPQEANNQKPIAVDDAVDVRPGRKIAVEALANDSDPDGDPISLVGNGFEARPELGVEAADGGKVLLTAPAHRRQRERQLQDPGRQESPGQRRDPGPDQPGRRAEAARWPRTTWSPPPRPWASPPSTCPS